jgi:hypothetical protein
MHVSSLVSNCPKPGLSSEASEDAFAPGCVDGDFDSFRCAVADGASTSAYARPWAQLLVRDFIAQTPLAETQAAWREVIDTAADGPWWLTHKVAEGAHAALLGLALETETWQAIAWGDACLFQVRSSQIICSFPLQSQADFPDQPMLLSSIGDNPAPHRRSGEWLPGDHFYLATDAVARQLFSLPFSDTLWEDLAPTNDDMTLMHLQLS